MKVLFALVALCLAGLALVPSAQAHVAPPRDELVGCQRDFGGARAIAVPIGLGVLCVDATETWCTLWVEWTAIPQTPTCLIAPIATGAAASAVEFPWPGGQTPDVQCMDVYSETYLAQGYWLVRRDSCSAEIYWCPQGYSPPAPPCQPGLATTTASAAAPAVEVPPYYCMPYERRLEAGPVTVIQGGCGNDVRLCDDGDGGSSLLGLRSVQDLRELDTDCLAALTPPIECAAIYSRYDVGPVALVLTSGCSGHVELCGTPVHQAVDTSCLDFVGTPPVNCLPYQNEIALMPGITIVQGGCGSYVILCGTRVTADPASIDPSCLLTVTTTSAAAEPNCLQVYRETQVGPLVLVQRDSCHSETYLCEDDDGVHESSETLKAYLNGQVADPDPLGAVDCTVDSLGLVATSGVDRMCWRQGQGELQTVTCVDPNSTDCTIYRQQITGVGSSWVCYPSGESGSDW